MNLTLATNFLDLFFLDSVTVDFTKYPVTTKITRNSRDSGMSESRERDLLEGRGSGGDPVEEVGGVEILRGEGKILESRREMVEETASSKFLPDLRVVLTIPIDQLERSERGAASENARGDRES